MDINTVSDISKETDLWIGQDFIEDANNRFDRVVIECYTIANQPKGVGKRLKISTVSTRARCLSSASAA
jgi:hypothetical protein